MFADVNFYLNCYGGNTNGAARDGNQFKRLSIKASQIIKDYTGNNLDLRHIPDCVKMCCCEIIDSLYKAEQTTVASGGVKSESVGGWSKTYGTSTEIEKQLKSEIGNSVELWLTGTGLLYRGI